MSTFDRDPTQHAALKDTIESQSTAYYSTARLWDDGVVKPTETRDVLGLALALAARRRKGSSARFGSDGDSKGFGVFRM
jgi:3-methylcrotonyl-CoA carboxylase beta subunit